MTEEFARETGALTVDRWKIGVAMYLGFAFAGGIAEWRYHPDRAGALLLSHLCQIVVLFGVWRLLRHRRRHPESAWPAMLGTVAVCVIVAVYNAVVGGDFLYVLMTYLQFMLVGAVFVPWGAAFQLRLDIGIIGAYTIGLVGQANPGPTPVYDYLYILAGTLFSTIGAWYMERYRRTVHSQAAELRQINQRLETVIQARSDLLSGLSHDMRTPLAVVIGYGDMLADSPELSHGLRTPVHSIRREAHELLNLVDGVLELARIEGGRLPFQRSTFALADVLGPLRETTEDMLIGRDVGLEWDVHPSLSLDSDANKVREIVRNLLSNAVKFTEHGAIVVRAAAENGGVRLTVSDTGVGIASEHIEDIFDPFRQINPGAGRLGSGSGFGLYLVKLLVNLVGGRIEVESAVASGSTFNVWLPASPPHPVG